jgi:iron complex transport system substrate-binding protein
MISRNISIFSRTAFIIVFSLLFTACQTETSKSNEPVQELGEKKYYPEKASIKHAKGFTIRYFDHYKVLHLLSPFDKTADTAKYVLLQRGTKKPAGYLDYKTIEIPIKSMVAMSSMHIGLLGFLDSYTVLTGLANLDYVYAPEVIAMIEAGKIAEIGKDQGLNEEKLVTMQPGLVMAMGSPGAGIGKYQTLEEAGIPVLINSEWVETTPLARAEWVKLVAALLNKEELANRKFAIMEKEYNKLAELGKQAKTKPTIISGLNMKDTWFLPAGNNFMVQFFNDAGSKYHWSNTQAAGSLALNFEAVYPVALHADYWLNVGFDSRDTKEDILAQDSRYSDFKAYKSGRMYSYNYRVNEKGSNDFFESGNVNPQTVLADLIKILHPELLPGHQLVYYKQLK